MKREKEATPIAQICAIGRPYARANTRVETHIDRNIAIAALIVYTAAEVLTRRCPQLNSRSSRSIATKIHFPKRELASRTKLVFH